MGKVLGAVAAGILTVASGGTFLGFTGLAAGLLSGASSLVLSGLTSALTPKPKSNEGAAAASIGGSITQQVRQPITARRAVYGEMRVSGPYAFIGSTNDNQFLHFILMLASHEVDSIGEIWANDDSIPLDALDVDGNVISGKYAGLAKVVKYNGTSTQGADSTMMAAFPEWTTNHRLQGIAYIYVRLQYNRDTFASGIPNFSAWLKGKKLFDSRTSATVFHHNPTLMVADYLADNNLGIGVNYADIEDAYVQSGANTCEEMVTTESVTHAVTAVNTTLNIFTVDGVTLLFQTGDRATVHTTGTLPTGITDSSTNYFVIPYQRKDVSRIMLAASYEDSLAGIAVDLSSAGTGDITIVKNAEPRYSAGGVVQSDAEPNQIIIDMLSSMAGTTVYSGGKWRILAGKYETPEIAFDEDDLAGSITLSTKTSRKDRFNSVIGTYTSPLNNGQPSDYPNVKNSFYATQDQGRIDRKFDLLYTQRPMTAQRLAKIALEISRQEFIFTSKFKLSAFKVQCGDNVLFSNATYGWVEKPFNVVSWALKVEEVDGGVVPYIEMSLKETAATVYDWNSGEETQVDPAPNTTLPNIANVAAPTGLSFDSVPIETIAGDVIFRLILNWDAHPDTFVTEGGDFEIQYKLSSDITFKPSFFVDGVIQTSELTQASAGTLYDLRIRAVNNRGVRSNWQPLSGVSVGSSGGVTSTEDWGNLHDTPTSPPASTADWGDFSGSTTGDEDWGGFI